MYEYNGAGHVVVDGDIYIDGQKIDTVNYGNGIIGLKFDGAGYVTKNDKAAIFESGGKGHVLVTDGDVVAPTVKGTTELCIGNDCRSTWPAPHIDYSNCVNKYWKDGNAYCPRDYVMVAAYYRSSDSGEWNGFKCCKLTPYV